jgi:hypothetical protein
LVGNGGRKLIEILEKQKEEIEDYYGAINEIKAGVRSTAPDKPDLLAAVDLVKRSGLPLVAGGVLDQPHIWLVQLDMAQGIAELFAALNHMADQPTR